MDGTTTKTTTVSAMKIAVALAFLGGANLLAAASMLRPNIKTPKNLPPPILLKVEPPDLIITKMTLGSDGSYDGVSSIELNVQYQNIGKGVVDKPFQIAVNTDPAGLFGEDGFSMGQAYKASEIKGDDNKYNLVPGESAMMKIALNRNAYVSLSADQVRIIGYSDYLGNKPEGNVPELNENNNDSSLNVVVAKSPQAEVVSPTPDNTNKEIVPEPQAKVDVTQFCDANVVVKPSACADRLATVPGLPTVSYEKILNTYPCAGVYQGVPIIKVNGKYNVLEVDGTIVLGGSLSKCSLSVGGMAPTVLAAKKCVDELHTTFETSPVYAKLYLNGQTCFDAKNFCAVTATDDSLICEKRLKAMSGLSKTVVDDLLKKYSCAGVYKGMPLVKVQNQVVPLQMDSGLLLSYSLSKCTLAELGVVTSLDIAEKCVDQLGILVQNDPMYVGAECAK